jgi:P27 family predicted phage terminase small subunit
MRGRKPKPKQAHILNGTFRADRHGDTPDFPRRAPSPPDHLDASAKKEWKRVVKVLLGAGLLTTADRAALAAYCQCYARWADAEKKVQEYGAVLISKDNKTPYQSPYLSVASRAMEQMLKFLIEFGLTPSSRARVKGTGPVGPVDPMEALLDEDSA